MYKNRRGQFNSTVKLYAAFAKHRLIERRGAIPWKRDSRCTRFVREDIKRLRTSIQGGSVILGRKTYESICNVACDPIKNIWGTQVLVMSRNPKYLPLYRHRLARSVKSLDEALDQAVSQKICIFGGASIYQQCLEREALVDEINLTVINRDYGAKGIKFPDFNESDFEKRRLLKLHSSNGTVFEFFSYNRKRGLR